MSDFKALKLPDISSNVDEFFEFTAKEYNKQIEIIDYIPLLDTRSSDLLREKLRPELERINSELLDLIKQKKLLMYK